MNTTPGWPSFSSDEERPRRKRGWWILGILALVIGGAATARFARDATVVKSGDVERVRSVDDTLARAPSGARVRVRVLNASGARGLARRVTLELRDRGFDVVDYDTERGNGRSKTAIIVHTGRDDWAARLQRALGAGTIETRPDSLRYVDLTVYVGRDWKSAAETLRP